MWVVCGNLWYSGAINNSSCEPERVGGWTDTRTRGWRGLLSRATAFSRGTQPSLTHRKRAERNPASCSWRPYLLPVSPNPHKPCWNQRPNWGPWCRSASCGTEEGEEEQRVNPEGQEETQHIPPLTLSATVNPRQKHRLTNLKYKFTVQPSDSIPR